jgi:signal transduction histidine kinase
MSRVTMSRARQFFRAAWNEPRAPDAPRRVWRDGVLIALLLPTAVLEGILRPDIPWRIAGLIIVVGLLPTLLWRRTRPLHAVAIAFGTHTLVELLALAAGSDPPELYSAAYVLLLPYALFRWGSGREKVMGLPVILMPPVLSFTLHPIELADMIGGSAVLFAALELGTVVRYRAKARSRQFEEVKVFERERLARDLHDTVAHHISAIAIRAQAGLAVSATDPAAARSALQVIEAEASRTLSEMRSMVRVLRHEDGQAAVLAPVPLISDLGGLSRLGADRPAVQVEITGEVGELAPALSAAVYRLAQESVTNAHRHARHASRIAVSVAADERAVRLRVSDDGEPVHPRADTSPGYGLIGMTERAGLLGGSLSAGPDPEGGWTVTAELPRNGSAS